MIRGEGSSPQNDARRRVAPSCVANRVNNRWMATTMPSNVSTPRYRTIRFLILVRPASRPFLKPGASARSVLSVNAGASQLSLEEVNRLLASIALDSGARVELICWLRPCHLRWCSQRAISRRMAIKHRVTTECSRMVSHEVSMECSPYRRHSEIAANVIQRAARLGRESYASTFSTLSESSAGDGRSHAPNSSRC